MLASTRMSTAAQRPAARALTAVASATTSKPNVARVGAAAPAPALRRSTLVCRAEPATTTVVAAASSSAAETSSSSSSTNWVPVLRPEDLPKGSRREVRVNGRPVLLFWYRNQVYAIEARSPAEGAYSEGFADAKLTQDFCIECPTTKTLFSLKTGEVVAWYPTNPILRALTPRDTCRALDIFPVRLTQEAISVDASGSSSGLSPGSAVPSTRGGADSSIDRNNVYAISPKTYTSDDDFYAPSKAASSSSSSSSSGGGPSSSDSLGATAATITSIIAVAATGAAGTAVAVYKDLGPIAIVAVWIAVGAATFAYSRSGKE